MGTDQFFDAVNRLSKNKWDVESAWKEQENWPNLCLLAVAP